MLLTPKNCESRDLRARRRRHETARRVEQDPSLRFAGRRRYSIVMVVVVLMVMVVVVVEVVPYIESST